MSKRYTSGKQISRRELMRLLASGGAGLGIASFVPSFLPSLASAGALWAPGGLFDGKQSAPAGTQPPPAETRYTLSASDDAFLEELERANFLFFWEQTNPNT